MKEAKPIFIVLCPMSSSTETINKLHLYLKDTLSDYHTLVFPNKEEDYSFISKGDIKDIEYKEIIKLLKTHTPKNED